MEVLDDLRPARRWASTVLAALLIAAGLLAFTGSRSNSRTNRGRLANATATTSAQTVLSLVRANAAQLRAAGGALGGVVPDSAALRRAALTALTGASPTAVVGVARIQPDGAAPFEVVSAGPATAAPSDLAEHAQWRVTLELARDGGDVRSVAALGPDGKVTVLSVLALYGPGPMPASVLARRDAVQAYVATIDSPDAFAGPPFMATARYVSARLVQGPLVLTSSPGAGRRAPSSAVTVRVADPTLDWSVLAWPNASHALLPWFMLLGAFALAGVALLMGAAASRANAGLAAAAGARESELRLVASSGRLLQRSLDIADILPMFAVELSDELGLDGIAISRVATSGELVTAFAFGTALRGPRDPARIAAPRPAIEPGEEMTLILLRGDRAIGALSVRAGRTGLGRSRTEALQAISELLAAALANARIFQEEQAVVGRLRELDRMKTTFLGSVSHELRTTVTAIKGFAQLLTRPGLDLDESDRTDYLQRIDRNANSLAVLVDDLLDFASLERQSLTVTPQPVNLSDLVPDVVNQTSSIMSNHAVTTSAEPGIVAVADASAVERILFNLLTNAAKYTPPGTEVQVTLVRRGPKAVLAVADRGPGIPAEERAHIFDRFYRVDNVATRAARGVGIGLALVRELVGLLNGSVVCEDTPGGGTRFVVELTLVDTDPAASPSRTQLQAT